MQLVYLWVEKYRNLENQGFNFNPKYQCHYDVDKNFLSIEKTKNHQSIFHDRLSVTPIVGENGAGKSSVLELILKVGRKIFELTFKCCILYSNNKGDLFIEFNSTKIPKSNIKLIPGYTETSRETKSYLINHNQFRSDKSIKNHIYKQSLLNTLKENDSYLIKYMSLYQKYHKILEKSNNKIMNGFVFNAFTINFKKKDIDFLEEKDPSNEKEFVFNDVAKNLCNGIINKISNQSNANKSQKSLQEKIWNNINTSLDREHTLIFNTFVFLIDFFRFIIKINIEDAKSSTRDKLGEVLEKIYKEPNLTFNYLSQLFSDLSFKKYLKDIDDHYDLGKTFNKSFSKLEFINRYINKFKLHEIEKNFQWQLPMNENDRLIINEINKIDIFSEQYDDFIDFISFSLLNKNTNTYCSDLSSGELSLFKIFVDTIYYIHLGNNINIIILADEFDNFLHPIWKTQLIKMMVDIFELYFEAYPHISNHIHLIFTTHSPFLISDIPRENIIFMKDGQQVQSLNQEIQTFGANIHTLLTHGFFMQDGLMGCFARSKIDDLIKKINKPDEMSQEEIDSCEYLISIIGEPIIKKQLQRMLDRRRLSKVDQIDRLREEMNQIREKIAKLENGNGKN